MPTTRDPFPFPHYENEETCTGSNRCTQKTPYCVPTHLAQQRDPWNRLHGTPTLASIRREIWYTEPEGLEPVKERTALSIQQPTSKGISVRHWVNPVRESIHNIEGAIESHHTAATNSGYSRKENGGIFYH
ncbi:cilia- and flagella-associated protein 276 isoform X2 [Podarcis muralis]